jgi:uncharacterized protein
MKKANTLSTDEARFLALNSQLLLTNNNTNGKAASLAIIEHLGYIQIDTLSVVARAHHHAIWSRNKNYREAFLHELLEKDKQIFEYWSHAASYLPMSDYRFSLIRKEAYSKGKTHWFEQDKKIKKYVLDRIKAEGALQSKDFEYKRKGPGNWYEWKPAKRALEQLFMEGKLMVAARKGFQKVYDLTERVLPHNADTRMPSEKEYAAYLIKKAIQANGLVEESEITYLRNAAKKHVKEELKNMEEQGFIVPVKLKDSAKIYYTTAAHLQAINIEKLHDTIDILSPFDNAVIQRKRLKTLFDFDYMIECYLPENKRKYGYFCLPVLYKGAFVARLDPKADRASQTFFVKQLHFEKNFKPTTAFKNAFHKKLKQFALFNGCDKIVFENSENALLKK